MSSGRIVDKAKDLGDEALGFVLGVPAGLIYYALVKYKTRGMSRADTQSVMLKELKLFGADLTQDSDDSSRRR